MHFTWGMRVIRPLARFIVHMEWVKIYDEHNEKFRKWCCWQIFTQTINSPIGYNSYEIITMCFLVFPMIYYNMHRYTCAAASVLGEICIMSGFGLYLLLILIPWLGCVVNAAFKKMQKIDDWVTNLTFCGLAEIIMIRIRRVMIFDF